MLLPGATSGRGIERIVRYFGSVEIERPLQTVGKLNAGGPVEFLVDPAPIRAIASDIDLLPFGRERAHYGVAPSRDANCNFGYGSQVQRFGSSNVISCGRNSRRAA